MKTSHTSQSWLQRAAVLAGAVAVVVTAAGAAEPDRYTATAVNMGAPVRWTTTRVEMVINRWSTDSERDRLVTILQEQGPEKLLDALRDIPRVGYIRTPDSIGYDLHFARRQPGDDGAERVVLATDRYVSFWEAANQPRTIDYPFTVIELRLRPNGEGEGKMSLFTKVTVDPRTKAIELEDYGTQPVLLQNVRRTSESRP